MQNKQLEHDIWQQLQRASVDKHHEWRSPVLVTNGLKNEMHQWPEARTVILRAVNIDTKQLTFYTDSRSPKVAQIAADPHATIIFWSKRLNWQLRVKVTISVDTHSDLAVKTWQKVKQSPAAGDYLSDKTPGEILYSEHHGAKKNPNPNNSTTVHFAMLIAKVACIDWLALNRDGHQRALIDTLGITYLMP